MSKRTRRIAACRLCAEMKPITAHGLCSRCYQRRQRRLHPERHRAYDKRHYEKHHEERKAKKREWARKNRDLINARRAELQNQTDFDGMKPAVLARYGGRCADCGASEGTATGDALHIHHLDGTGRSNCTTGAKPNNGLDNLIPLCSSCHGKRHHRERDAGKHERILCGTCGQAFIAAVKRQQKSCSKSCALKARHAMRREEARR